VKCLRTHPVTVLYVACVALASWSAWLLEVNVR
jgi:hypothetical protein